MIAFAAALAAVPACLGGSLQGSGSDGGGGATGMNCASIRQPVVPAGLDVMILLDTSPSMNDSPLTGACAGGCGADSKWAQTTTAIRSVVGQTDQAISWGLALLGDSDAAGCGGSGTLAWPVMPGAAGGIASAINRRTSANGDLASAGERLTSGAVNGAAEYFTSSADANLKLIVLVTDGVPSCMSDTAAPDGNDTASTVDAIAYATEHGFSTFVVGVATGGGPADMVLAQMALVSGVPRAGNPVYYPVASTSDLVTVLNVVTGSASCLFTIPEPPNADVSRFNIGVIVDGNEIPHDQTHANGWDYANFTETHLRVHGPSCDAIMNSPAPQVAVAFKCSQR
jgi:hypothetical protein